MEKDIEEKIDELLTKILKNLKDNKESNQDCFKKALRGSCKIHLDKTEDNTQLEINGNGLTVLIALAGAEKAILEKLNCSELEFEYIKNIIGTKVTTIKESK